MFSNVWSENTALFERLMEIHSNAPKLYYGFKFYTSLPKLLIVPVDVGYFSLAQLAPSVVAYGQLQALGHR